MTDSFTLSVAAVDILAEALGADCRRFPFQLPGIGDFVEDRVRIAQAVFADLSRRRLIRNDELDPAIAGSLRLLGRYRVAIAVMGTLEDNSGLYARVSSDGEQGLLVTQDDQMFRFEPVRPESLARTAVSLLPRLGPGHGQSVTITPASAVATEKPEGFTRQVRPARTPSQSQLAAAQEMLRKPRTGAGYFIVSAMDRDGRETRAPGLSWLDTGEGRYMAQAHDGEGAGGGTFAPADPVRLVQQLEDLMSSVLDQKSSSSEP